MFISKKKVAFCKVDDIKKIKKMFIIGPGASGKTRLLHKIYNMEIEYKGPSIIKNKVFNEEGKSLKYDKNVFKFTDKYSAIYIAPNYKSLDGYKPNIDEWIYSIKKENGCAVVCYVSPFTHKKRLENRIMYKKENETRQHLDNYPFSYQNLFYELEKNNLEFYVFNTEDDDAT